VFYKVDIIMANALISRTNEHYQNPEKFIPERWIRGGEVSEKVNPYVTLPFGHGARKCVGMRFASLELELAAAKVRNFESSR
jgi:cytochrome P450